MRVHRDSSSRRRDDWLRNQREQGKGVMKAYDGFVSRHTRGVLLRDPRFEWLGEHRCRFHESGELLRRHSHSRGDVERTDQEIVRLGEDCPRRLRIRSEVVLHVSHGATMPHRSKRATHRGHSWRSEPGTVQRGNVRERADRKHRIGTGSVDVVPTESGARDDRCVDETTRGCGADLSVAVDRAHPHQLDLGMSTRAQQRDGVIGIGADVSVDPEAHAQRVGFANTARNASSSSGC